MREKDDKLFDQNQYKSFIFYSKQLGLYFDISC